MLTGFVIVILFGSALGFPELHVAISRSKRATGCTLYGNECGNHGNCDTSMSTCHCHDGYTGTHCTLAPLCTPGSTNMECGHHGDCGTDYQCSCRENYAGSLCQIAPLCKVGTGYCGDHGTCTSYGHCSCRDNYRGSRCTIAPTCMEDSPCQPNGFCDEYGECRCNGGYRGQYCQLEPFCASDSDCNGHQCSVTSGYCSCNYGYKGDHCEIKQLCTQAGGECGPYGFCDDMDMFIREPQCICNGGFTGDYCNITVEPVCSGTECGAHGYCSTIGTCNCNYGYSGEFCEVEPFQCSTDADCSGHGQCVYGSSQMLFRCECEDGFEGKQCQNESLCSRAGKECGHFGNCQMTDHFDTANYCACNQGYSGDLCTVPPICSSDHTVCGTNGYCNNKQTNYECECVNGYNGTVCEIPPACVADTECGHHGVCQSYVCKCTDGYSGAHCEINHSVPQDDACSNIFQCHMEFDRLTTQDAAMKISACVDFEDYLSCMMRTVPQCESAMSLYTSLQATYTALCSSAPGTTPHDSGNTPIAPACVADTECGQHGVCQSYVCKCADGFSGAHCEISLLSDPSVPQEDACSNIFQCHMEFDRLTTQDAAMKISACVDFEDYLSCMMGTVPQCESAMNLYTSLQATYTALCSSASGTTPHDSGNTPIASACVADTECGQHGVCQSSVCKCTDGFSGSHCEINYSVPREDACSNIFQCHMEFDRLTTQDAAMKISACVDFEDYLSCMMGTVPQCESAMNLYTSLQSTYTALCSSAPGTTPHGSGNTPIDPTVDRSILASYIQSAKLEAVENLHQAQEAVDAIEDAQELMEL